MLQIESFKYLINSTLNLLIIHAKIYIQVFHGIITYNMAKTENSLNNHQ